MVEGPGPQGQNAARYQGVQLGPLISPEYAALNKQLHEERFDYGSRADGLAVIIGLARTNGLKTILDFGCGKGALKLTMQTAAPDLAVLEFDPAVPGKDKLPDKPADLVVALDVMEHIEPEYLENVLSTMRDMRPKAVLLSIALQPANKTLPDGRNAHLIVESADWWRARLAPYFKTGQDAASVSHLTFLGTPLP